METERPDAQPERETAQTNEQGGESQKGPAALPPVVEPAHAEAEGADAEAAKDEADREQDEAIEELAEQSEAIAQQTVWMERQTEWMAKQTRWVRNQFWAALALGVATFFVLAYQSVKMSGQLDATNETVEVMRGQLKSMESSSQQTQDLINATRDTANASQSVAEQNRELVKHAGEQAKASVTQAEAAQDSAGAAKAMADASRTQAGTMKDQAAIMRNQFEITDRPWLSVEAVSDSPLKFNEKEAYFAVTYRVKNIGRSVATKVQVFSQAYVQRFGGTDSSFYTEPVKRQRATCENVTKEMGTEGRPTIFPNDSRNFNWSFNVPRQEMEANRMENTRSVLITLCGCVEYTFGNESAYHQTGFIYIVEVFDPQNPSQPHAVRIDEEVPANQLLFLRYPWGGDYAN